MNSDFTAHSSFSHLQKDPDGTTIQIVPLRCTDGGLRCNGMDYIRKKKKGCTFSKKKDIKRESKGSL